jgi:hypothetical protein
MGDALIEIVVEVAAEGLQLLFELWLKGRADRKAAKKIAKKQVKLLKKEHRAHRRLDAKQSRELRKKIRKLKLSDFIETNNNEVN